MQPKDLTGATFGRLTVLSRSPNTAAGKARWRCSCACGKQVDAISGNLIQGKTTSCGCVRLEALLARTSKGGRCSHPLYSVWLGLKKRCYNPADPTYRYYGAKGVQVCDRWLASFWDFVADMGERPLDEAGRPFDIDRIDPSKDYSPENCRWLSKHENYSRSAKARWAREKGKS